MGIRLSHDFAAPPVLERAGRAGRPQGGRAVIRFLVFFLGAFLLAVFQSTLVGLVFPAYLKPDLMIILVTFLGIAFPLLPGAPLALFCGLLYDAFSGGAMGLFAFIYLFLFFSLKLLAKFLILGEAVWFRVILAAVLMGVQFLLLIVLPALLGMAGRPSWPGLAWILPQVLATCAAGWPLFYLLRRADVPPADPVSPTVA